MYNFILFGLLFFAPATTIAFEPERLRTDDRDRIAQKNPTSEPAFPKEGVQIVTPPAKQFEPGAVLSIFADQNSGSRKLRDPSLDSPKQVFAVPSFTTVQIGLTDYQEVRGYILVDKTATYNFSVAKSPTGYSSGAHTVLRINNIIIGEEYVNKTSPLQGQIRLKPGWHRISVVTKGRDSAGMYATWAPAAQQLTLLDEIYREVPQNRQPR
ncbi:MAG: hypothetical protein KME03_03020 [Aphanocapsa lilacina HA4352-LM1]|jgi:hypothetical protein|nr:hypothetical protein [Aphanocapsa lilacina HA4352-LM1]